MYHKKCLITTGHPSTYHHMSLALLTMPQNLINLATICSENIIGPRSNMGHASPIPGVTYELLVPFSKCELGTKRSVLSYKSTIS